MCNVNSKCINMSLSICTYVLTLLYIMCKHTLSPLKIHFFHIIKIFHGLIENDQYVLDCYLLRCKWKCDNNRWSRTNCFVFFLNKNGALHSCFNLHEKTTNKAWVPVLNIFKAWVLTDRKLNTVPTSQGLSTVLAYNVIMNANDFLRPEN